MNRVDCAVGHDCRRAHLRCSARHQAFSACALLFSAGAVIPDRARATDGMSVAHDMGAWVVGGAVDGGGERRMGGIRACGKAGSVEPVQHSERSARQITNRRHMRGYVVEPAVTTSRLIPGKCVGSASLPTSPSRVHE